MPEVGPGVTRDTPAQCLATLPERAGSRILTGRDEKERVHA
jgi:hypothetical protein